MTSMPKNVKGQTRCFSGELLVGDHKVELNRPGFLGDPDLPLGSLPFSDSDEPTATLLRLLTLWMRNASRFWFFIPPKLRSVD